MATRVFLLIALAAFLFEGVISADDATTLPSRKATVVIPLLEQLSIKDTSEKGVMVQFDKILGEPEDATASPGRAYWDYTLDDKTRIWVSFGSIAGNFRIVKLNAITVITRDARTIKTIYPKPINSN